MSFPTSSHSAWASPFSLRAWSYGGLLALLLLAGAVRPAVAQVPLQLLHRVDSAGQNPFEGRPLPARTTVVLLRYPAEHPHTLESAEISRKKLARLVLTRLRSRDTTLQLTDEGKTPRRYPPTAQSDRIVYVLARTPDSTLYESYVNTGDGFVPGFDAIQSGRMTMGPIASREARRRFRAVFRLSQEAASAPDTTVGDASSKARSEERSQAGPRFRVQLYATTEQKKAESFRSEVRGWWSRVEEKAPSNMFGLNPPLTIEHAGSYYRVLLGAFSSRTQARRAQEFLSRQYPDAFVVRTSSPERAAGRVPPDSVSARATAPRDASTEPAPQSEDDASASPVWMFLLGGLVGGLVGGGAAWLILSDRLQRAEEDQAELRRKLRERKNQEFREATGTTLSTSSESDEGAPADSSSSDELERLREENETLKRQIGEIKQYLQNLRDQEE